MSDDAPVLTETARAQLERLIDRNTRLSCGGIGVRNPERRAAHFDGTRRSIFAMYWLSQGKPWPDGMLRCTCPHNHSHCLDHRAEDNQAYSRSRRRGGAPPRPQKAPPLVMAEPAAAEIAQPEEEAPVAPPPPIPPVVQPPPPGQINIQRVAQPLDAAVAAIYDHEQAMLRGVTFTTGALRPPPTPPVAVGPTPVPPAAADAPVEAASAQHRDQPEGASPFPERERDDPAGLAQRWVAPRRARRHGRTGGAGRGRLLKAAAAAAVMWTLWFAVSQVVDAAWPDWKLEMPSSAVDLIERLTRDDGTTTTTSVLPQTPPAVTEAPPPTAAPPSSLVFCVPADEAAGRCTR